MVPYCLVCSQIWTAQIRSFLGHFQPEGTWPSAVNAKTTQDILPYLLFERCDERSALRFPQNPFGSLETEEHICFVLNRALT